MQIGTYAATKPFVCIQCKGKGCSNCDNRGIKVRNLHVICEKSTMNQHTIAVQNRLKEIKGTIVVEKEEIKILEETKDD